MNVLVKDKEETTGRPSLAPKLSLVSNDTKEIEVVPTFSIIPVNDEVSRAEATERIAALKKSQKEHFEKWEEIRKPAYDSYKNIQEKQKAVNDKYDAIIKPQTKAVTDYLNEQERIRQEAQRKADEEARKKADAERERLAKQAEKAIEQGKEEKAEELIQKREEVFEETTIISPTVEKTIKSDTVTASTSQALVVEEVNAIAFIEHAVKNKLFHLLKIDSGAVKKYVQANNLESLPGFKISKTAKLNVRAK